MLYYLHGEILGESLEVLNFFWKLHKLVNEYFRLPFRALT